MIAFCKPTNIKEFKFPSCEGGEDVEDGRGGCFLVTESWLLSKTKKQPATSAKATVAKAPSLRSFPSFAESIPARREGE